MLKELGLFDVILLTVTLYTQWDQFIIFPAALSKPSRQLP